MSAEVVLRRGRAKPIWAGHPWILSGAVAEARGAEAGAPGAGDVVLVVDHEARSIGKGFYAPASPLRVRMLTRDPAEEIDEAFLLDRIRRAAALRTAVSLPGRETDVFRLVHSDGDGLPGVVADVYGQYAVIQLTVAGMERRRDEIARAIAEVAGVRGVRLRRVPAFEEQESLEGAEGDLLDVPVPEEIAVRENGIRYLVDPARGQKTGHYADHRDNRAFVGRLAAGRRVLDAFCGTGGFALAAAAGGAKEVVAADSSPRALEQALVNADRNGVAKRIRFEKGDVFRYLRRLEKEGERFDMIVLDPPRMAQKRRELKRASKGYKELNLRALRLLTPGGILATASCTGILDEDAFEKILREAAFDAKRALTVFHRAGQAADHPWSIAAPESRYLKFVVGRVS